MFAVCQILCAPATRGCKRCRLHGFAVTTKYRVLVGTGLIYAMVVGLWALFLLPMWLRNHEQFDEGRQVDRFRRAMTQLSQPQVEVVSSTAHKQVQAKRAVRAGTTAAAPLSAAARRRRVLAVLAVLQLVGMVASLLGAGVIPVVLPALLIVGFLTLARAQVRLERSRLTPAQVEVAGPAASLNAFARALAAARSARRPAERSHDVVEQAPAAPSVGTPASWQPVRTPAPSYVSAPAATAVPRAIDSAGGWTGSAMVEAARAMAEQPEPVAGPVGVAPIPVDADITAEIPVIRITA